MSHPATRHLPQATGTAASLSIQQLRTHCNSCNMRELCLPVGLAPDALRQLDELVANRARLKKNEVLYRAGETFAALYAIRLGSLKTTVLAEDGREQITGYHMIGDILGMDGIGSAVHGCEAIALEDSEVCAMPFERLEHLAQAIPALQQNLLRFLSRNIGRDQGMMLMLGRLRAEERLAVFLLNLSERYQQRGYSPSEFVLRMTREEIGSYLGLKLETVSRLFSRFQEEGLLQVSGRNIKIFDMPALKLLAGRNC